MPTPKSGEEQGGFYVLGVHELEALVAVAVLGPLGDGVELAEHGLHVHAVFVAASEEVLKCARLGHRVEGGVGDESVDLAGDQQTLLAVDVGPLHAPLLHRRIDMADEGISGLVIVVVSVEHLERQISHVAPQKWERDRLDFPPRRESATSCEREKGRSVFVFQGGIAGGQDVPFRVVSESVMSLAGDFDLAGRDQWMELVEQVLRGAPFDKKLVGTTYDGIRIQPLYTGADHPGDTSIPGVGAVHPGQQGCGRSVAGPPGP